MAKKGVILIIGSVRNIRVLVQSYSGFLTTVAWFSNKGFSFRWSLENIYDYPEALGIALGDEVYWITISNRFTLTDKDLKTKEIIFTQ
jgi:hypothetical protein